jgi:hypothetical protein
VTAIQPDREADMTAADRLAGAGADASAKVVDLSAYRARRLREREQLPLFAVSPGIAGAEPQRVLSDDEVRHRKLMLRHLETGRR